MKTTILTSFAILAIFLSSCKQEDSPTNSGSKAATYYGHSQAFGGDSIRSWIKTDVNGDPTSIGVSFKQSAFVKIEGNDDTTYMLMLPMSSGMSMAAPFDHIEIDWSKKGDPDPPYNVAHFDVHFFCVDTNAQNMVVPGMDNLTMMMDTGYVPHGYMMMMDAEAMMGVHFMDTTDHDIPFNHTCMYGFYHGDLYFMEPMVAKTYLDSKTNFSSPIKQPTKFKKSGWYPTKYSINYSSATGLYSVSIDGLTKH